MIHLELIPEQIPVIATIIESPSQGLFDSKIRRYLRDTINETKADADNKFPVNIDNWVAVWLLSTLYASDVDGAAGKLMYDIEDAFSMANGRY